MEHNFYKQLIEELPTGYAHHRIICDKDGIPCDFEVIEVNKAFEKLTGLKALDIVGKKITTIIPNINKHEFDWIKFCGDIAINGGKKELKQFSEAFKRWYKVDIHSPEKYYFITYFNDITKEMDLLSELERVAQISEEFLQLNEQKIDYQKISDDFIKISGAKYVGFYLFDEDGKNFNTIAISGDSRICKRVSQILGFKIVGKKWAYDPVRAEQIKHKNITHFHSLRELVRNSIPKSIVLLLEKTFSIGDIILIKILRENTILGGFTLFMEKGKVFEKEDLAEIYAKQLGMVITRNRAEDGLKREKILTDVLSYYDQLTGLYNRKFYEEELNRLDTERNIPITIVMADVNGLKFINDSLGPNIGDELLKKVARIIKLGCRSDDIIARLGGDEFVVLLPKTDSHEAEKIIKRIVDLSEGEKVGAIDISISFGYETKKNTQERIDVIIKNAEDNMYKNKLFESPSMRGKTINVIISTLHEKNKREEQHSHRVSLLCKNMGEALGLPDFKTEELKSVGLLHDIGKVAIDENILNKPGKLTNDEWSEIKRHPEIGYRILSKVDGMSEMAEYVLTHHERWDGRGYPKGLKGKEIPFVSRIIAIVDAYDAMTSVRSYGSALSEIVAVAELIKNAGIQFDPDLVNVFVGKVLGK